MGIFFRQADVCRTMLHSPHIPRNQGFNWTLLSILLDKIESKLCFIFLSKTINGFAATKQDMYNGFMPPAMTLCAESRVVTMERGISNEHRKYTNLRTFHHTESCSSPMSCLQYLFLFVPSTRQGEFVLFGNGTKSLNHVMSFIT